MERKKFLKSLGAGAAFALVFPCLGGCSKDEADSNTDAEPQEVDFTIDLDAQEAAPLAENGGYILKELVVVARNLEGQYVAATQICSHQNFDQVRFTERDGGIFFCDVHGSRFDQNGAPLNAIGSSTPKPIKVYNTTLDGRQLRVFG